jgi:hypothetical protein
MNKVKNLEDFYPTASGLFLTAFLEKDELYPANVDIHVAEQDEHTNLEALIERIDNVAHALFDAYVEGVGVLND